MSSSELKASRTSRSSKKSAMILSEQNSEPIAALPGKKIYIYLQLKTIENLPKRNGDIQIRLQQADYEIPRLDRECTPCRFSRDMECNVTFSFPVLQDSIEDLNSISDNPVLITLYEIVKVSSQSTECEEEVRDDDDDDDENAVKQIAVLEPIGQGYIDLLEFFQKKRFSASVDTFIYPVDKADHFGTGATHAVFQIYTLLPLLKDVQYTNLVFITFESIYNCVEDVLEDTDDLIADVVFRAPNAKERGRDDVIEICTFTGFKRMIINEQNTNIIWESAKAIEQITQVRFGFQSDNCVNINRLFKRLVTPEYKILDFDSISIQEDEALVCNSTHRFILTEELRAILEELIAYRLQGLLVRIYKKEDPDDILFEGTLEPSIFMYPSVNAVRFAVVFEPASKPPQTKQQRKSKKDNILGAGDAKDSIKPMFGIISICFLNPITDEVQTTEDPFIMNKLKFCRLIPSEANKAPLEVIKERAYDDFDDWVTEVVDYIIKNNIRDIKDARAFFCCQSQNAQNRILPLIALDFNKRFPTKTNLEFCNLMVTVYKELEERVHKTIQECSAKGLEDCRITGHKVQKQIIRLMDHLKIAGEMNDFDFSATVQRELKENHLKDINYNFYIFLHNVENKNYDAAQDYIAKPAKDRRVRDEYFTSILAVYIQYMKNLEHEEEYNEAHANLLGNITDFLKCQKDIDGWILLYCLYKKDNYLPGMEFARWHYEDKYEDLRKSLNDIPYPRFKYYLNYDIVFNSKKSQEFYKTVQMFEMIGAYKFAEIVFNEIAEECTDIECYLETTTLQIVLGEVTPGKTPRHFEGLSAEMDILLQHVNGNLLYGSGNEDHAMDFYQELFEYVNMIDKKSDFQLGLKRYANHMNSNEQYQKSLEIYETLDENCFSLTASLAMGKINYKLGFLRDALKCFKSSTYHNFFMADVWAYLALIHLKLGENYHALECWKYAKHNPNAVVSAEVIDELNKINVDEVDLWVDKPQ